MTVPKRSKVGRPCAYSEPKVPTAVGVTEVARHGFDALAKEFGLSRSEFVEQIGRGVFLVVPNPSLTHEGSLPEAS